MATTIGKTHCVSCGKEKIAYRCEGCSQNFCVNHLADHHRELGLRLSDVEIQCNLFQEKITKQTNNPHKQLLVQEINQWEIDALNLIRQTADNAREVLTKHSRENLTKIEDTLTQLTRELREARADYDFNEWHLKQFEEKLKQLEEQLNRPSTIAIQRDSSAFIYRISVAISSDDSPPPPPPSRMAIPQLNTNTTWGQNGITVAGGNGQGSALNQLACPFYVHIDDDDQKLYVADRENHRIIELIHGESNGRIVAGGKGSGGRNDQLSWPTIAVVNKENDSLIICDQGNQRILRWPRHNGTQGDVIVSQIDCYDLRMDNNGYFFVVDRNSHAIKRYRINGTEETIIAGGNGIGTGLHQLNQPRFIWLDQNYTLYISDYGNHRIMQWANGAKEGVLLAGSQGPGNCPGQLCAPRGVIVDQLGTLYIADSGNFRVMRWLKGAKEGSAIVGANGQGKDANQFYNIRGLSFDRSGNLYAVDTNNHRVQKFNIEPYSQA